jgi:hypothetical protein
VCRARELEFFANHSVFKGIDSSLYGVESLSKKLTLLLVSRIQRGLAPMKQTVEKELGLSRAQLRSLNAYAVPKTNIDRQKLLVSLMQEYLRHLTDSIRGEYRDRIMVQNPGVRMYTAALKIFEEFQFNVSRWFCSRYVCETFYLSRRCWPPNRSSSQRVMSRTWLLRLTSLEAENYPDFSRRRPSICACLSTSMLGPNRCRKC